MDQMVKFQKYFFLATGFLLGSLIPLFGNAFNFILIVFMFVQIGVNRKEVLANLWQERKYLWVMVIFLAYFSLHTIILLLKGNPVAEPSYGTFEILILNFILVPVYVTTFRNWLTPELLRRFLTYFCIGCFCINAEHGEIATVTGPHPVIGVSSELSDGRRRSAYHADIL